MNARTPLPPRTDQSLLVRVSLRGARLMVHCFPRRFRRRYGPGLLQNTADLIRDTRRRRGLTGLVGLWPRLVRDLVIGGLRERARPDRVLSPESPAMLDTLLQDIRYATRAMRNRPVLSALALITLALGVGASASMFSVIDGVLLQDLPYPEPDRLMSVYTTIPEWREDPVLGGIWNRARWSYEEFESWNELQRTFTRASVFGTVNANLVGLGAAERVRVGLAGVDLLPMLGGVPLHGRLFSRSDLADRTPVATVSFSFWRDRLGADPEAIGRSLELDGRDFRVVGVLPDGFGFESRELPIWLPAFENRPWGYFPGNTGDMEHVLTVTGRLAPEATPEAAAAEMARLLPALNGPDHFTEHGGSVVPRLVVLTERVREPLMILMGAVILLLLVACANVATFLLGQAIDRQQEIAIRGALGAGAGRILRQLLTESLLLGLLGGLLGLLFASQGVRALTALAPADLPRLSAVSLDLRAVAFALGTSLLSGALFGLAPALFAARSDLARTLGAARFGSSGRSRMQAAMIVGEVALATVLLVGAGLLVRSFLELNAVDPGFRPEGVLRVDVSPDTSPFYDSEGNFQPGAMDVYMTGVQETLAALPGISSVAVSQIVPFAGGAANNNVTGEGYDGSDGWTTIASRRFVDPGYHSMLGIELLDGRFLAPEDDRADAARVVLVSESLARRFWAEGEAVGKQLAWWGEDSEVVGVVADIRERSLDADPLMTFYSPRRQWGQLAGDYLLQIDGAPSDQIATVRAALTREHPELVVVGVEPVTDLIAGSLAEARYRTRLIGVFALVAAVLSVLGLYAVTSRSVAGRTREIGIRVALGAGSRRVISMLVSDGIRLAAFGAGVGILASLALTRALAGMLYGIEPHDPLTLVVIGAVVGLLALAASLAPSLRATRVDTVNALRAD